MNSQRLANWLGVSWLRDTGTCAKTYEHVQTRANTLMHHATAARVRTTP